MNLEQKSQKLQDIIRESVSAIVAFSGGVDSALLSYQTHKCLGNKMLAVIADSSSLARRELDSAVEFLLRYEIPHRLIKTNEFQNQKYLSNPANRCYFCKKELFTSLSHIATKEKYNYVFYGENADDASDFRPGRTAAAEFKIKAPLLEAGFTKENIRELAKELGLPLWSKPASPCLSSRLPAGEHITQEKLKQIENAEELLQNIGVEIVRVRYLRNGSLAVIESDENGLSIIGDNHRIIALKLRELGFEEIQTRRYFNKALKSTTDSQQ